MEKQTRRRFLQSAGCLTAVMGIGAAVSLSKEAISLSQAQSTSEAAKKSLKLGLASYTLRNFSLERTLAETARLDLKYISLKDFHLPLNSTPDECQKVAEQVRKAGIELYGGGVIYMRNEAEVHHAFDYAKAAGIKVIIGVPQHELLPLVNRKVQEYDIKLAIHNHGPTDKVYPTPASAYELIKDLDKRIGLCNDIGHTMRAGVDPAEAIEKYADRLLDVHIKDVTGATKNGRTVEIGRGVIDIPKVIKTLLKIEYQGVLAFEYEKNANDPFSGLAESAGYVRGVLAAV